MSNDLNIEQSTTYKTIQGLIDQETTRTMLLLINNESNSGTTNGTYYVVLEQGNRYFQDVFGTLVIDVIQDHTDLTTFKEIGQNEIKRHLYDITTGRSKLLFNVIDKPGQYTRITYQYILDNYPELII